jgi:hypothetical protein
LPVNVNKISMFTSGLIRELPPDLLIIQPWLRNFNPG